MRPKLISYKLCPYVHKAAIAPRVKNIPYDIEYINLSRPPQWFRDISPLGKVPLLLVDNAALFESTAIIEYLDEVYPPRLHPAEPVERARNRAWMAQVDACLGAYYRLAGWKSDASFPKAIEKLHACFDQLEPAVAAAPFFNGPTFSLVDAAFGPLNSQVQMSRA
jgi:glutathione S-transferase